MNTLIDVYFSKEKGIYILSSHAGPMQDARRLKPKRPKPANCKQEN